MVPTNIQFPGITGISVLAKLIYINSIVNWGHEGNFKPVYFFFHENILSAQKHSQTKNQLIKQK